MGMLYELLSTPVAYAMPAHYDRHPPRREHGPVTIPFGPHRLQHCVLWEPEEVAHETVVMYFHGGGYLVGAPESMRNAADVYNSQGYRFVSVGFRLMPHDRFPAQVDDAFAGIRAAREWLLAHGRPCSRVVVGGSSCGGHLAYLVAYSRRLQQEHGFDPSILAGVVSVAGVADADDMLLKYFPTPGIRRLFLDLPGAGTYNRDDTHEALLSYSPLALIRDRPHADTAVPAFIIHGRADKMSPYRRNDELTRLLGGRSTLFTLNSWWWQHMILTVTLHKHEVGRTPCLDALFRWLTALD